MTAPSDNTFDVIVVGGGISGRRSNRACAHTPFCFCFFGMCFRCCTSLRDVRRFLRRRLRFARSDVNETTVAHKAALLIFFFRVFPKWRWEGRRFTGADSAVMCDTIRVKSRDPPPFSCILLLFSSSS